MKNQKGITLIALTITIVLFTVILATITFSSISSVHLRRLNNMYADINALQSRIDSYYLQSGMLPVYTDDEWSAGEVNGKDFDIKKIEDDFLKIMKDIREQEEVTKPDYTKVNPNDTHDVAANGRSPYRLIKVSLLGDITLNNYSLGGVGGADRYLVNTESHQVYYSKGVVASEDTSDKRYSIPFEKYRDMHPVMNMLKSN